MTDTDNSKDTRFDIIISRNITQMEYIGGLHRLINLARDQTWSHTRYRESQWIQAQDLVNDPDGITETMETAQIKQMAKQFAQEEGAAKKGQYRIGVDGNPEIVTVEVTIPDPETTAPYKAMEASERAKDVAQGCSPILCEVRALDRRADLLRAELNELDKGVGDLYDAVSTSEEGGND